MKHHFESETENNINCSENTGKSTLLNQSAKGWATPTLAQKRALQSIHHISKLLQ